jgi:hypothetical protein
LIVVAFDAIVVAFDAIVVVSGFARISSVLIVSSLVNVSVFFNVVSLHGVHESHNASKAGSTMLEFCAKYIVNKHVFRSMRSLFRR